MLSRCAPPISSGSQPKIHESVKRSSHSQEVLDCQQYDTQGRIGFVTSPGVSGSAWVKFGYSTVIATVLAPKSLSKGSSIAAGGISRSSYMDGSLQCEVHFASHITYGTSEQQQNLQEQRLSRDLSIALNSSILLSSYPKSSIIIHVTILKASVFDFSCVVNATTLALVDAKVELKGLVSAFPLLLSTRDASIYTNDQLSSQEGFSGLNHGSCTEVTCCSLGMDASSATFVRISGFVPNWNADIKIRYIGLALSGCASIHEWMMGILTCNKD